MQNIRTAGFRGGENFRFGIQPSTISLSIREPGAALTHFAAFLLILIGASPLLMRARLFGSGLTVFSFFIFLCTAAGLYAASACYHTGVCGRERTLLFKRMDHMMISVMIAGSYTPFCLLALRGAPGFALLVAIWGLALLGAFLKFFFPACPKRFSSLLYLGMGWLCLFALVPLWKILPHGAFFLLLAGGVAYSVGAIVYALRPGRFNERHPYFGSHEIFHIFIMLGTFCHCLVLYRYLAFCK